MNILLVHPEGNLNYNANLLGLVEILGEAGHRVTYVAPRRPKINQQTVLTAPAVLPPLDEQREIVRRMETLLPFADQLDRYLRQS